MFQHLAKEFPDKPHPNEKTLRRWRQELSVQILTEEKLKNPVLLAGLKQHIGDLAKVAKLLLADDLDLLEIFDLSGERCYGWILGKGKYKTVDKEYVTDLLWDNIANATEYFRPSRMVEMFISHFQYETSSRTRMMNMLKDEPMELIQRLQILVQRKTFKGTCEICKDWW